MQGEGEGWGSGARLYQSWSTLTTSLPRLRFPVLPLDCRFPVRNPASSRLAFDRGSHPSARAAAFPGAPRPPRPPSACACPKPNCFCMWGVNEPPMDSWESSGEWKGPKFPPTCERFAAVRETQDWRRGKRESLVSLLDGWRRAAGSESLPEMRQGHMTVD